MANGLFNRPVDAELKFMASATLEPGDNGATANATGVNITSLAAGDENVDIIYNVSAAAGTIDADNYIEVEMQASADNATYYPVKGSLAKVTETGAILATVNLREIADAIADADYFRVTATQTGTTATTVTLEAYFSRGV
jgi:hypothetical protein